MNNFVAIEGNIGAGKTTLATRIAQKTGRTLVLEEFEYNEFLPLFYNDPDQFGLHVELSFLVDRVNQLKKLLQTSPSILSDYYIYKCLVFAMVNLEEKAYMLFKKTFDTITNDLPKPDKLIFIARDTDKLLSNIATRGRNFESEINSDYLMKIDKSYDKLFHSIGMPPVLIISSTDNNWLTNASYDERVIRLMNEKAVQGIHRVRI